jgi:alpha-tubulin suppressor-like RCC1 family protein
MKTTPTPTNRLVMWAAALAAAIVLTACGGGGGGGEAPAPAPIQDTTPPAGTTTVPPAGTTTLPPAGSTVTLAFKAAVATGDLHTCALQPAGTVLCWGLNNFGQLGNGTTTKSLTPVPVTDLNQVVGLSANGNHSCALQSAGTVRCWGGNNSGQLGNGTTTKSLTSVAVTGLSDAKALASGANHNCAIRASGSVVCWGDNSAGQLGDGTKTKRSTPVAVAGLTDAVALSVNGRSSCAVRAPGTAVCWGVQFDGQLFFFNGVIDGPADSTRATTTVAITGLSDVRAISAGLSHGCAIVGSGAVKCWGFNAFGELGNGSVSLPTNTTTFTTTTTTTITTDTIADITAITNAVPVTGITNAVALSTGGAYSCALLADKTIKCWGNNSVGQLGDGSANANQSTPVAVQGLTDAVSVSGSVLHTCALRTGGALSCWVNNSQGQLGDGTTTNKKVPTPVLGGNIFFQ